MANAHYLTFTLDWLVCKNPGIKQQLTTGLGKEATTTKSRGQERQVESNKLT